MHNDPSFVRSRPHLRFAKAAVIRVADRVYLPDRPMGKTMVWRVVQKASTPAGVFALEQSVPITTPFKQAKL